MSTVDFPSLTNIQQGRQDYCILYIEFGMQYNNSSFPHWHVVPKANSNITIMEDICQHGWEYHAEQVGGHYTALLETVGYWMWLWQLAIILHSGEHAIMELPDQSDEPVRTAKRAWSSTTHHGWWCQRPWSGHQLCCKGWHFVLDTSHATGLHWIPYLQLHSPDGSHTDSLEANLICDVVRLLTGSYQIFFTIIESREMPLWLSQAYLFPFCF